MLCRPADDNLAAMVNHAIRRGAVKRLRAVGLSYDLSVVSDNASKAKVLEMAGLTHSQRSKKMKLLRQPWS